MVLDPYRPSPGKLTVTVCDFPWLGIAKEVDAIPSASVVAVKVWSATENVRSRCGTGPPSAIARRAASVTTSPWPRVLPV